MLKNLDFNKINGYILLMFTAVFPLPRAAASIFIASFSLYFIIRKIPIHF